MHDDTPHPINLGTGVATFAGAILALALPEPIQPCPMTRVQIALAMGGTFGLMAASMWRIFQLADARGGSSSLL